MTSHFLAPSPTSDALCLDAIEDAMGAVGAYADLAREHSKINDLRGLEYDLRVCNAHFRVAVAAFKDIAARRAACNPSAEAA